MSDVCPINVIPNILKYHIVPYLDFKSLVRLRCVCRFFRERFPIVRIPQAWQHIVAWMETKVEEMVAFSCFELPLSLKRLVLYEDKEVHVGYLKKLQSFKLITDSENVDFSLGDLPESLQEIDVGRNCIFDAYIPNVRTLTMYGITSINLSDLPITRLNFVSWDTKLPKSLTHLTMDVIHNRDLRDMINLYKIVVDGNHGYMCYRMLQFPALGKFTVIGVQNVNISFDTSVLTSLKMYECFHPHLLESLNLNCLVVETPRGKVDLFKFLHLKKYRGTFNVMDCHPCYENFPINLEDINTTNTKSLTYKKLYKLTYNFRYPDGEDERLFNRDFLQNVIVKFMYPSILLESTSFVEDEIFVTDIRICKDIKYNLYTIVVPLTVRELTLVDYRGYVPISSELRKLTIIGSAPKIKKSIKELVLRHVVEINLSKISVDKLVITNSHIIAFPRNLRVFEFDKTSSFPDTKRLNLM